jgi:hypothetical protein
MKKRVSLVSDGSTDGSSNDIFQGVSGEYIKIYKKPGI